MRGREAAASPTPTPAAAAPAATPQREGDLAQLERLMERRAAALAAGRVRAYAATATGPQRDRDRAAARNARGLGLRDVELVVDSADVVGRRATLRVRSLYGVRGVRGTLRQRAPRHRGAHRRRLARAAARRAAASATRGRSGPCRRCARATSSSSRRRALEVGGAARTRSRTATRAWATCCCSPRLRDRYLVVVAGGAQAARALTEQIRGVESLAAISDAEVREDGAAQRVSEVVSQRLVVVWPPFSTLGPEGRSAS